MLKIEFKNAKVMDNGYGLYVNGNELDKIISTALGTRVDNTYGYNSGLHSFNSDCCNVTVIVDPQPVTETVETEEEIWYSAEDLEECKREQYTEKAEKAES